MIFRLLILLVLALVLVLLSGSVPAARQSLDDYRWPEDKPMIVYADQSYREALLYAAKEWNRLGHPVRIVPSAKADTADVLVWSRTEEELSQVCHKPCLGIAGAEIGSEIKGKIMVWDRQPGGLLGKSTLLMHELGHVIGLPHSHERCALMNFSFQSDCGRELFHRDDLHSISKLYPDWQLQGSIATRVDKRD